MYVIVICAAVFIGWLIWKYWTLLVGAGYDPTPIHRVRKMLELARVGEDDVVYDLGCGDGRIITTAARVYGAQAVGIEIDPFRFLFSWFMVFLSGKAKMITVQYGNFFKYNLRDATVVTIFLFQPANNRLAEKFQHELRPGTRIVSYVWEMEGWEPLSYLPDERIYLYIV
jgi:SAM-dependent methyltransferase